MKLKVAGIIRESVVDGPGVRLAVYVQGCAHRCPGCHNPGTWDQAGGIEMDTGEIIDLLPSTGTLSGVTLSGGEPFDQPAALLSLADALTAREINLVLYSGYTFEQLLDRGKRESSITGLLKAGWLLIDGPYLEQQRSRSLPYRGSRNQRLIDLKLSMPAGKAIQWNNHFF